MIKKKKAVIFGLGHFAEVVDFYLSNDSQYEVVAFTATGQDLPTEFVRKPVVNFNNVENIYSPETHEMFIAIGCRRMNDIRADFCQQSRDKNYKLLSYISSKATHWSSFENSRNIIGENVFIFENNVIQPFVEIEDGTILWSGNHIGHHSKIGRYCFITSHVVVSGSCSIGDNCFIGVNSTLRDGITLGQKTLIGAHSYISSSTAKNTVYSAKGTEKSKLTSDRFFR